MVAYLLFDNLEGRRCDSAILDVTWTLWFCRVSEFQIYTQYSEQRRRSRHVCMLLPSIEWGQSTDLVRTLVFLHMYSPFSEVIWCERRGQRIGQVRSLYRRVTRSLAGRPPGYFWGGGGATLPSCLPYPNAASRDTSDGCFEYWAFKGNGAEKYHIQSSGPDNQLAASMANALFLPSLRCKCFIWLRPGQVRWVW